MRYFLCTITTKEFQDYVRDLKQDLAKYKRQVNFAALEYLHFNYKFLGLNLSPDLLRDLHIGLEQLIKSKQIMEFTHSLRKVRVGEKSANDPLVLKMDINKDDSMLEWFRFLNLHIVNLSDDIIARRQDHQQILGITRLGIIRKNASVADKEAIVSRIKLFAQPTTMLIDNISIIGTDLIRNKLSTRLISTAKLLSQK